jgi:hypothetical protein
MATFARKATGHHTTLSSTAPTGSETNLGAWARCRYCERALVCDGPGGGEQFVFVTASGPSCPSCDRHPLDGHYNP